MVNGFNSDNAILLLNIMKLMFFIISWGLVFKKAIFCIFFYKTIIQRKTINKIIIKIKNKNEKIK